MWSPQNLAEMPERAKWAIHCNDCNPHWNDDRTEACVGCYWYDATRCNTPAKLLAHTAHLMEKNWLEWTDWNEFIRLYGEHA